MPFGLGGVGMKVVGGLAAGAAVFVAATLFVAQIRGVYTDGYNAGVSAHALAGEKAARIAQDAQNEKIQGIEAAHAARVQELENEIVDVRRRAAAAASRERSAFNAELVRLRNEARARRNASRADDTRQP